MPYARLTDPTTSHDAAASVENVTATQKFILTLFSIMPLTDEDLVHIYQQQIRMGADERDVPRASESGIRSRRAELVKKGLIVDSGLRQRLTSGRNAIVWVTA